MIKKFLLCAVVLSQFAISCSSDDNTDPTTDPKTEEPTKDKTLAEQIAELVKKPYSSLTPAQQKQKLEVEANEMLVQLNKTKSSSAIEAIQNLGHLFSIDQVDIFDGKSSNGIEEILNISGVYGIYTWDNTKKIWVKTASKTELKFIFPAKKSQTTNNAVLSANSVSSDIKVKNTDTYGEWNYDSEKQEMIHTPTVYDYFFLPTSTDATLTIDNVQSASLTQTAKYSNSKPAPDEFAYKMSLNDGYVWEMSGKKGTATTSKAVLTYNGKILVDFNGGSSANIDALLNNEELAQYKGKANGLFTLLDNFVIIADMDLATEATDREALYKSLVRPAYPDYDKANSNYKAYYTTINANEKKQSEGIAAGFNKNFKLILVSKKDGTKIAELVQHSDKSGEYTFDLPVWYAKGGYWTWDGTGELFSRPYLDEVLYLKFNDNTEVAASVYFSTGFNDLLTKYKDFAASFKK
ncbi:hypothetical protein FLA105534_03751 [Flavobacterium bizetiae]|uniref:Lipoprotein n=1 Tax=Flavobacterium bizetiae TaxID=2704140 RepID=A0A6J4GRB0_9FLAO|nr:hypothetical protein [Flavobacterium bizetiae]CAA9201769.1 hypothetical protein FLA105534_03751 [Flavobacterium bizetiae]CAD5342791.1 hypothetical protein FLA105535_02784 [Flavobacterium bizetiae]CAD5348500.1 hypothetical protein FLA105534_02464 [Flavobacterium bizetiae]